MSSKINIKVTAESVCDLPQEYIEGLPLSIIPYYVNTENGRFADGTEIGTDELLHFVKNSREKVWSQEPEVSDLKSFFKEQLKGANYILHITIGKNVGKGYSNAVEAAKEFENVYVFDSGFISCGTGLVVLKAVDYVKQGLGIEKIIENLSEYKKNISCTFMIKNLETLENNERFSKTKRILYEGIVINPCMKMINSGIHPRGFYVGDYYPAVLRYLKSQLSRVPKEGDDPVYITYVGLREDVLAEIKETVASFIPNRKVVYVRTSAAITCNCGEGTCGIIYVKKAARVVDKEIEENIRGFRTLKEKFEETRDLLINDSFSINQKILNLILAAAVIGGCVSGIISILIGEYTGALVVFVLLFIIYGCLRISVVYRRPDEAAVITCIASNVFFFPLLYFVSGGMQSGIPIWFVLGLVFDWMILKGKVCYIIFTLNVLEMLGCILIGQAHPNLILQVTEDHATYDVLQTFVVVSLILGVVYKYQSYLHDQQHKELQEREEELLRLNSTKDIFLANMSHEIRTPINGIIGMNTMLMRECNDQNLLEYSMNIQSASQTLLSLINDILDVSKVEAGKLEIIEAEYDTFSVINDCYQIAHSRSVNKGLEFEIEMDPEIPSVLYGDEVRIKQIINNILSNAVKYTRDGYVKLSVGKEKISDVYVSIKITVEDTGIGIKEEDKKKIFQSFSRVDEKKNRDIEGTGLGLNLTQSLVNMMKGTIELESVYGHGSKFIVTIPQRIVDRAPIGDFTQKYKEHMLFSGRNYELVYAPGARALVVDDVSMNLLVAKGLLKYTGMQVDTSDSGQEALNMVMKNKYDIIFLDHLMPEMDGIECLHRMKGLRFNPNESTPIIVLTANAVAGVRDEYIKTGFSDYLSKPLKESELNEILSIYLPKDKLEEREASEENVNTKAIEIKDNLKDTEKERADAEPLEKGEALSQGDLNIEKLKKIPEIDTQTGLKYCIDDEDFYIQVIKSYIENDKTELLNKALEEEDIENYKTYVHALKSTSLNIGAKELSAMAKESENACKENDFDSVKQKHGPLMEKYKKLMEALIN
ncbi:MAG: DegV family EDD domain-containing protein [Butyrivibrio sp.]|nr:DegV family EDD domain-containing protein [Butyrivibrio sp.]